MLTARGWPEREVYDALADHYQGLKGIEIPRRRGVGASAKEAFFYLVIFLTLATWTIGFAYLAFALIDRWLADPLFFGYQQMFDTMTITSSMAAVLVAFPLYLLVSRAVLRELAEHPETLESPNRNWLTYMALVVAAGVLMGDLITALSYLLRGELTSRFLAKAFVVLLLSGGIFSYYFGGLRRSESSPGGRVNNRLLAAVCAAAVGLLAVLGFWQMGSPRVQREMRADTGRVRQMYQLSLAVNGHWNAHGSQLPASLEEVPGGAVIDPVTHAAVEYRAKQGSRYELCTTFARSSDPREAAGSDAWAHPAGHHCFSLDAVVMTNLSPQYLEQGNF